MRDFILRPDEDRLRLRIVTSPPIPFPPEPLRSATIETVRHELDRADRNDGRRGLILQTLDALGDRLRLLSRTNRRQAGVATQFGSSRDSVASGSEPWPRTASWNARRSKLEPSRADSSARSRSISRWPTL